MKGRERLRFHVYSAVRGAVLDTALFRSHSELNEPEIVVNVYAEFVDAVASLTEGQVRLLPVRGRAHELHRFGEELRRGLGRIAPGLRLEPTTESSLLGRSQPVLLVDVPIEYRAIFRRLELE